MWTLFNEKTSYEASTHYEHESQHRPMNHMYLIQGLDMWILFEHCLQDTAPLYWACLHGPLLLVIDINLYSSRSLHVPQQHVYSVHRLDPRILFCDQYPQFHTQLGLYTIYSLPHSTSGLQLPSRDRVICRRF